MELIGSVAMGGQSTTARGMTQFDRFKATQRSGSARNAGLADTSTILTLNGPPDASAPAYTTVYMDPDGAQPAPVVR